MELIVDITEHEWEYLNKLVENGDQLGHYERLLVNGHVLEQQPSDDCVSRQAVLDLAVDYGTNSATFLVPVCSVKSLPPVAPTHGTCKDCKHNYKTSRNTFECSNGHRFYMRIPDTFYCADYEKRGNEE